MDARRVHPTGPGRRSDPGADDALKTPRRTQMQAPSEALFLAQIVLLLLVGRLVGEAMQRIGQPAVMGQMIAGVLLGPSVFGAIWPEAQRAVFAASPQQQSMIDGVSQLGILMLLLLTGMETDLRLVKKARRAAISASAAGIVLPFASGFALGELLPAAMIPNPDQRIVTSLFLGTALSIASVKILATVVREMGFIRRNVGMTLIASAIIDDTVGWVIVSITLGLAVHGTGGRARLGSERARDRNLSCGKLYARAASRVQHHSLDQRQF